MLPGGQQCRHGDADVGGTSRGLLAVDALRDLAQRLQAGAGGGDREVPALPESAGLQARRGSRESVVTSAPNADAVGIGVSRGPLSEPSWLCARLTGSSFAWVRRTGELSEGSTVMTTHAIREATTAAPKTSATQRRRPGQPRTVRRRATRYRPERAPLLAGARGAASRAAGRRARPVRAGSARPAPGARRCSQQQLADAAKLHRVAIARLEEGRQRPTRQACGRSRGRCARSCDRGWRWTSGCDGPSGRASGTAGAPGPDRGGDARPARDGTRATGRCSGQGDTLGTATCAFLDEIARGFEPSMRVRGPDAAPTPAWGCAPRPADAGPRDAGADRPPRPRPTAGPGRARPDRAAPPRPPDQRQQRSTKMQMRARLSSDDQGWRQNRHDHHKGRARTLTSDRVSPQLSAHSPRLCRRPAGRGSRSLRLPPARRLLHLLGAELAIR